MNCDGGAHGGATVSNDGGVSWRGNGELQWWEGSRMVMVSCDGECFVLAEEEGSFWKCFRFCTNVSGLNAQLCMCV